jgi:glycosyltransferase involved in cell wall biosynthesis
VRHSREVAGSPEAYRSYIQQSRGEFSCAKPSCIDFQNAWISDRTLCYLASGKPAVVQHTGPSVYLPDGEGLFRFTTLEEAAAALEAVNTDYGRHCRAAREIAEAYFDAEQVATRVLNETLGSVTRSVDRPVPPPQNEVLGV